jgi:acetyl esterase/lipase
VARVATISKGKGQAIKEGEFGEMNTDGAKGKEKEGQEAKPTEDKPEPDYTPDMDEMRCMLYLHGGGYYFGSVDQQRLD